MSLTERNRDIFPLPSQGEENLSNFTMPSGHSRCSARRLAKKMHKQRWLNEAIFALNELSGAPYSKPPRDPQNAGQAAVISRLTEAFGRVPPPPTDLTEAGAYHELCGSNVLYQPAEFPKTAPYNKELVSWPPIGSRPSPLGDNLDGAALSMLEDPSLMLREIDEIENESNACIKTFAEPTLCRRPYVYADFLKRLEKSGMVRWRVGGASNLGLFFVKKKSGKLRIIFDTFAVNGRFRDPPQTRLPTSSALGGLETDARVPVWYAGSDIADCFYHIGIPEWLGETFSLPGIQAKYCPWARPDGFRVCGDDWLVP